jgi:AraC-like DNA-binding protein
LIDTILLCTYKNGLRRHFINGRIKELLIQYLIQWSEVEPAGGQPPTEIEIEAVYAAEKMITEDIRRHFILPELARNVHLSEFRFKIVFKKIFGTGAYEYLQKKRLKKAMELLKQGYSVKEVAAETGYHVSHFITLFREYFGITPGSIKRSK